MGAVLIRLLVVASALTALLVPAPPASASARVTIANGDGAAVVDPTYATTVTVRGQGFQSVEGGHGGIYVFFGTVRSGWRPSQGGHTGEDYFYVPDSESSDNQGYQRYIAFPGSDTAGSAAGTMTADGSWSTTLVVPGAVFQAVDRNGRATSIDCRKVTCGVITVGAHGVVNAHNESFTPVRFAELYDEGEAPAPEPTAQPTATTAPEPGEQPDVTEAPARPAAPTELQVDRAAAHPGNVLAFAASGLAAGSQVFAVLDDGAAGAGPFLVGTDGGVAGVITIPAGTEPGTHELRLFGPADVPSVSFAVTPADEAVAVAAPAVESDEDSDRWAIWFAVASAGVLLLALLRLVRTRRGARRG